MRVFAAFVRTEGRSAGIYRADFLLKVGIAQMSVL